MAATVYQAPDRDIDLTAIGRSNMTEDTRLIDFHSSVAWKAKDSSVELPKATHARIAGDATLQKFLARFAKADLDVKKELGVYFEEASEVRPNF